MSDPDVSVFLSECAKGKRRAAISVLNPASEEVVNETRTMSIRDRDRVIAAVDAGYVERRAAALGKWQKV
jgi:hypothetical protein